MRVWINETIADVRGGRESWRVLVLFGLPAFLVAFVTAAAQHPH